MHTIEELIKVMYLLAYSVARGYDQFSNKRVQRWCKTWNGTRVFFTEYSSPMTSRTVGRETFQVALQGFDIKFVSGKSYSLIINNCFIDLDNELNSRINETRIPDSGKEFLNKLDKVCNELVSYYRQIQK